MNPYLTRFVVEAHTADLTEQARQARLARTSRDAGTRPGPLRSGTARLLVALATRLDRRLQPAPAR